MKKIFKFFKALNNAFNNTANELDKILQEQLKEENKVKQALIFDERYDKIFFMKKYFFKPLSTLYKEEIKIKPR